MTRSLWAILGALVIVALGWYFWPVGNQTTVAPPAPTPAAQAPSPPPAAQPPPAASTAQQAPAATPAAQAPGASTAGQGPAPAPAASTAEQTPAAAPAAQAPGASTAGQGSAPAPAASTAEQTPAAAPAAQAPGASTAGQALAPAPAASTADQTPAAAAAPAAQPSAATPEQAPAASTAEQTPAGAPAAQAPAPSPAGQASAAAPAAQTPGQAGDAGAAANDKATSELASLKPGFIPKDLITALNDSVINFPTGGAEVPASITHFLENAASDLKQVPKGYVLEIAGYTDITGDAAINRELSQRRADAVRDALIKAGADPDMLLAKGYGSADPIASNDTAEGRLRNRRIEYHVVKEP